MDSFSPYYTQNYPRLHRQKIELSLRGRGLVSLVLGYVCYAVSGGNDWFSRTPKHTADIRSESGVDFPAHTHIALVTWLE